MGHKKTDKENFYLIVTPRNLETSYSEIEFLVNSPVPEEELKEIISHCQKSEKCKEEDIKVEKIYMPLDEFKKKCPISTYASKEEIDELLKENEKYKLKPLSYHAAKTLAENPSFFKSEKATEEAKKQFEEAKKNLPKK